MFGRMGGFQVVSGGSKRQLRRSDFYQHLVEGTIEIPTITEGEIRDKSKGDDIAKTITLVQTLWFAIQAANRVAQGLTVTEFELTTLGHVVLNIFIFWCWWKKPLNVDYSVDLPPKRDEKGVDATPGEGDEQPVEPSEMHATSNGKDAESQWPVPGLPLAIRTRMGAYIWDVITDGNSLKRSWRGFFLIICFSIISGIFGAVHCIAWNSVFPSHVYRTIWRVSALIVTVIPGIICTLYILGSESEVRDTLRSPLVVPLLVVYSLARMCLLVIALIALRTLPYKAYVVPSWSRYIPHIG